jgi:hypothetical protein
VRDPALELIGLCEIREQDRRPRVFLNGRMAALAEGDLSPVLNSRQPTPDRPKEGEQYEDDGSRDSDPSNPPPEALAYRFLGLTDRFRYNSASAVRSPVHSRSPRNTCSTITMNAVIVVAITYLKWRLHSS